VTTASRTRIDPMARFVRLAWGRRLETGLTLAAIAARVTSFALLGKGVATLLLAVGAVATVVHPTSRRWLVDHTRAERLARTHAKVFDAVGIDPSVAPVVVGRRATPSGAVLDLHLSPRCTVADLEARIGPLAVAFGAATVRIRPDRGAAGRAQLVLAYVDPLAGLPLAWPWTHVASCDLWGGLPFGVDEDDQLVVLELAGHHLLLGGEPGAGKSNALSLVTAAAALDPDVELWCFDGKLVELAAWRRCARRFVGADVEAATSVLRELQSEMEARYAVLLERGLRKVDRETGLGLVVVVIDELALYTQAKGKSRDELVEVLRDIVARGRAAGIVVVAATQKPAADVVPTSIRDLFGCRMALRCSTRDASDTVLGAGWAAEGYAASIIDPATRGVGYLLAEGGVPERVRCFAIDDQELWTLARRAEELREVGR